MCKITYCNQISNSFDHIKNYFQYNKIACNFEYLQTYENALILHLSLPVCKIHFYYKIALNLPLLQIYKNTLTLHSLQIYPTAAFAPLQWLQIYSKALALHQCKNGQR